MSGTHAFEGQAPARREVEMRRMPLMMLAGVLALIGVGAVGFYVSTLPTTLTVAVGPTGSDNLRLMEVLSQLLQRERAGVRLQIVRTEGAAASALVLQNQGAQLAVVRSDVEVPAEGLLVANLRRDMLMVMVAADSPIQRASDLRRKRIGVTFALAANRALILRVLGFYGISPGDVELFEIQPGRAGDTLAEGSVDALFTVGTPSSRAITELVQSVTQSLGAAPRFVPIEEAAAIAQRNAALEAGEIVRGAFGGNPSRPPETVVTLAIVHRLLAHRTADESTVAALTQMIFALRPAIAADLAIASQIEAPDTDRGAIVPVHPGATAYVEGNIRTFLDRYGDWFYLIVMVVGIFGSGIAALASFATNQGRNAQSRDLLAIIGFLGDARAAPNLTALEELSARVDGLFAETLDKIAAGEFDNNQIAAYTLALEQVRHAIGERRTWLVTAARASQRLAAAE